MRIELACFACAAKQIVDDNRREFSPRNGKVNCSQSRDSVQARGEKSKATMMKE